MPTVVNSVVEVAFAVGKQEFGHGYGSRPQNLESNSPEQKVLKVSRKACLFGFTGIAGEVASYYQTMKVQFAREMGPKEARKEAACGLRT